MYFITSHLCLLILSVVIFNGAISVALASGGSASCPCRLQGKASPPCRDGELNVAPYRRHVHEQRGLSGSCLPEVEENTVRCFKWKTISCSDAPDFCELVPRANDSTTIPVDPHGQTATLLSPRFNETIRNQQRPFGLRWFCVYNVSLNCARNAIDISRVSENTTWPMQNNSDCENYLAFYPGRNNSSDLNNRHCDSQSVFPRRLEGSSFLAVMWSNKDRNAGTFQFRASCKRRPTTCPPMPTPAATTP